MRATDGDNTPPCWLTILHGISVEEAMVDSRDLAGLREAAARAAQGLGLRGEGLARLWATFDPAPERAFSCPRVIQQVLLWHDSRAVYCQITGSPAAHDAECDCRDEWRRGATTRIQVFELAGARPAARAGRGPARTPVAG
ncbi:hypothetical protein Cme02nite_33780 [Catellatospora methionotrophica]|uniref:Uncharacterized protein n=1 Tax=Catellatospora methionotrophica TaxID=121620 RepID=A0A8J3PEW2_9ACTN|nr:hypothetical protein [Catellatospora methionotrophica]GIG15046.1 hypothetical protein Cme02nite_33780 [Catellatospora methionotrophica]